MNDSDLELSVLEICSQGGYIAPIGAWKDTVERLHAQGLLEKLDAMNYVITPAGSAEFEKRENAEVMGVFHEQQALAKPSPVLEGTALKDVKFMPGPGPGGDDPEVVKAVETVYKYLRDKGIA